MKHRQSMLVAAATVVVSLLVPLSAHAASKSVYFGEPPSAVKSLGKLSSDVNAYFPSTISIHAGDSVKFIPTNFHNAEFPAKGAKPSPLITPGDAISGAVDAAGAPFWFNGQPQINFNPAVAGASGLGKTFTYTGAKTIESGLPLAAKPKPMVVKFPKTGRFTFYCDVHPGMKGTVKVVAKSKAVPSAKAEAARIKKQVSSALKVAKGFDLTAPANTVKLGVVGKGGVEYFGFAPGNLSVPVGTTVTFTMPAKSLELHTATTGPGNPLTEPTSFLGTLAATFGQPTIAPAAIYPSDPPASPATVSLTSHGNGFWNTGGLDDDSATPQPLSSKVTFTQAGKYDLYCLVHPFMHGIVTVG